MPGYILVGEEEKANAFIEKFKSDNKISDLNTINYKEKILIENVRDIIKSLSFISPEQKLYILRKDLTIEAQNAMLKNLEELESYNNIFFCTTTLSSLLPTIHSRCFIVHLGQVETKIDDLSEVIKRFQSKNLSLWELVDQIEALNSEVKLKILSSSLRTLLLDPQIAGKKNIYIFLKRILLNYRLIESNNVNSRIILERVFSI